MMDTGTSEPALRREAIGRLLQGERPGDICRDLNRGTTWLHKWWTEYQLNPKTDFADHSRAPHTSPHQTPRSVERAVVKIRRTLAAAQSSETRYGLVGHRSIQAQRQRLGIKPLPSLATIQRILFHHDLTHPRGAAADTGYYPGPTAGTPSAIHATDIITKHLRGGQVVQNFHPFDHYTHAVHISQHPDKTTSSVMAHLLASWATVGIPAGEQLDNESSFRGGQSHPRVIGRVVRLCLFVGVEMLFIPEYEAKRNYWVESFHSLWVEAFWSRQTFGSLNQVPQEAPTFLHWYHTRYRPPSLEGKTPAQMCRGFRAIKLPRQLRGLIPEALPITNGRINFIRKVDHMGNGRILNETWLVGRQWRGEYVWVVVNTANQTLTFWYKPDVEAPWKQNKTCQYRLDEPIHALLPEFRRDHSRCREHWPG
jgi:transposase-like protein